MLHRVEDGTAPTLGGWLYDNAGGSVLAAAIFHDMVNVTCSLFPVNGSYYNPAVTGVIEAVIAVAIIITQFLSGACAGTGHKVRTPSP